MTIIQEKTSGNAYSRTIILQWFKRLLPAQILSSATAALGSIINGLVVGNCLPAEAMVALGFVVPLTAMMGAIAAVISGGGRIMCGQYMGRGELEKLNDVFTATIVLGVVIGAVLSTVGLVFSVPLARLFGAAGETTAATAEYIRGLALGFIPTLLVPGLMVLLQMVNQIGYAFASTLVLAGVNLLAGLLNVKVFQGGIFGMGVANSAAQLITALFLLFRFVQKKNLMRPGKVKGNGELYRKMVALGSPVALANVLYATRNVVINSLALRWGGTEAVSSLAILNSAMGPFDAVNVGVAATALILASVFAGEKDNKSMELLLKTSFAVGLLCAFAKIAVLGAGGKWLAMLFGARDALVTDAYVLMMLYSLSMPLNMLVATMLSAHQALGRVKMSNTVYVFNAFVFPLTWTFVTGRFVNLTTMWLSYAMAEVFTLMLLTGICWKKRGHFPNTFADWLWMEEPGEVHKFSLSLRSMEQVLTVSEQLVEFCSAHGIDRRRSKLCGLCAEEMAGNVVSHGFTKSQRKDLAVDLFACCDDGQVTLRIRDNAPAFDPHTKLGTFNPEDPCKNVGIRMVTGMAKETNYQTCFGLNVLSIKL